MQTHNLSFSPLFLKSTKLFTHTHTYTHFVQLDDWPSLLTVWRPHDFIFGAVRGGPHYVSARLNGLFVLALALERLSMGLRESNSPTAAREGVESGAEKDG